MFSGHISFAAIPNSDRQSFHGIKNSFEIDVNLVCIDYFLMGLFQDLMHGEYLVSCLKQINRVALRTAIL